MHGVTSEVGDARVGSGLRGAMCGQLETGIRHSRSNLLRDYCIIILGVAQRQSVPLGRVRPRFQNSPPRPL